MDNEITADKAHTAKGASHRNSPISSGTQQPTPNSIKLPGLQPHFF
jgi:hypothetical protein